MDTKEYMEEEALLYRIASGSSTGREDDDDLLVYELEDFEDTDGEAEYGVTPTPRPRWWRPHRRRLGHKRRGSASSPFAFHTPRRRRSLACRIAQLLTLAPYLIISSIVICGIFFPSYSHPPERYLELRSRVLERGETANVNNEKIYIAASLYDHEGELLAGQWGQSVLHLVDILGPDNVFLSIYEDNPDEKAQQALDLFAKNITCQSEIVTEALDLHKLPHVPTFDGTPRLKRIAFLADVRNRALRPLADTSSPAYNTRFDKLLYLNDVMFDPVDAANLLLSTNVNEKSGKTQYRAACAVDFINPFKFYDTYATRDSEGYDTGVIFYPWFTTAGNGESRSDVLKQKDAVRVKSCWGGMVAFEAKWFQMHLHEDAAQGSQFTPSTSPNASGLQDIHVDMEKPRNQDQNASASNTSLRFRAETDTYWDSSECCLIHADLATMEPASLAPNETGIFMNPYIRVSYSPAVLPWLGFTKRFERLYTPINLIINWISAKPTTNERQFEEPGQEVVDKVWVWNEESLAVLRNGGLVSANEIHGRFEMVHRIARPGGFCGQRKLLYINEHPAEGERKWGKELPPAYLLD